jgi:hypothetical protein
MADKAQCEHPQIEVRSTCTECGKELGHAVFARAEFEAQQQASELPNRENMSLVNANLAAPINAALALNVLSDGSIAIAQASQYAPITQGI